MSFVRSGRSTPMTFPIYQGMGTHQPNHVGVYRAHEIRIPSLKGGMSSHPQQNATTLTMVPLEVSNPIIDAGWGGPTDFDVTHPMPSQTGACQISSITFCGGITSPYILWE